MSERAKKLVDRLLEQEGGYQAYDYSPEDLAEYQRLKAEQEAMHAEDRVMDRDTGQFTRELMANWTAFEKLRNKYNGMPPRQLAAQPSAAPPKASFYPSMGGPTCA